MENADLSSRLPIDRSNSVGVAKPKPAWADPSLDQGLLEQLGQVPATSYQDPWNEVKSKGPKAPIPSTPEWCKTRTFEKPPPYSSKSGKQKISSALTTVSTSVQELLILDDLLSVMVGIEGQYITMLIMEGKFNYSIDDSIDISFSNMIKKILPICSCFISLKIFMSKHLEYEHGVIMHAFCAAIEVILNEYELLIAQLDDQLRLGELTLQKLWFYIQNSLRTLQFLDQLSKEAKSHSGGNLLTLIFAKANTTAGDALIQELVMFLMERSSVPFFEMLEHWIYRGVVEDVYSEFFIEDHEELQKENVNNDYNDEYWERRYTIRENQLPSFMAKFSEKILVTGKYLNVVRESGFSINSTVAEKWPFTHREQDYHEKIDKAFQFASKTLLDLITIDMQLLPRLKSLKHYFLLDHGDFFVHFMDSADEELRKLVVDISPSKLNSLLELCLRMSISDADPFKDDLKCVLLPYKLLSHLITVINVANNKFSTASIQLEPTEITGLEAFCFDYQVRWPLSLVISRKALTQYQLIFRHLFFCKVVERNVCNSWKCHQSLKHTNLANAFALSFKLRHRMLQFVQQIEYYIFRIVLDPNWDILEENIKKATTLDEVLRAHNNFLDTCMKQCLLTDPDLVKIVTKLMVHCIHYAKFTETMMNTMEVDDMNDPEPFQMNSNRRKERMQQKKTKNQELSDQAKREGREPAFYEQIQRFENGFDHLMQDLIYTLNTVATKGEPKLADLVKELDFNKYYENRAGDMLKRYGQRTDSQRSGFNTTSGASNPSNIRT